MADDCDGECLYQADMENRRYFRIKECTCVPLACPNYTLCGHCLPACHMDAYNGRCLDCDITFGKDLVFHSHRQPDNDGVFENGPTQHDNTTAADDDGVTLQDPYMCPICYDWLSISAEMVTCTHRFCIPCIRHLFFKIRSDAVHDIRQFRGEDHIVTEYQGMSDSESVSDGSAEAEDVSYSYTACPLCRDEQIPAWNQKREK